MSEPAVFLTVFLNDINAIPVHGPNHGQFSLYDISNPIMNYPLIAPQTREAESTEPCGLPPMSILSKQLQTPKPQQSTDLNSQNWAHTGLHSALSFIWYQGFSLLRWNSGCEPTHKPSQVALWPSPDRWSCLSLPYDSSCNHMHHKPQLLSICPH